MLEPTPIPIANLLLDQRNPRLSKRTRGQRSTIRAMAILQKGQLTSLAKDIAESGLDPSQLLIVKRSRTRPNRYIVLDGNRRATALKVLTNPEVVKGAVTNSVLRTLKQLNRDRNLDSSNSVPCIIVNKRADANRWIQIKHTGYNNGIGPMPWNPEDGNRFRASMGGTLQIETQALDFLESNNYIDSALRANTPTTTLRRLLGTPGVRQRLDLTWDGNSLALPDDPTPAARLLTYITNEIAERRITARDLNLQEDRLNYIDSLPKNSIISPPDTGGKQDDKSTNEPADDTKGPQSDDTSKKQRLRSKLIPEDLKLNITDARVRDIEDELRRLSLRSYPNAVSIMFRVFLELSTDTYITQTKLPKLTEQSRLQEKMLAVIDHLANCGKLSEQEARAARHTSQKNNYTGPSITKMNQYVHNRHLFPGPDDLKADWDTFQPWFKAVWTE